MGILPISLFLLGVAFLLLGWRWQSSPSKEALTALKGLAYLKREIIRVQDQVQVHILEEKVQGTNPLELREVEPREVKLRDVRPKGNSPKDVKLKDTNLREVKLREIGQRDIEVKEFKPRELKPEEAGIREVSVKDIRFKKVEQPEESEGQGKSKVQRLNVKSQRRISPKYQEVLELAARGYRVPEIAQRLLLSQDAVGMVLRTQQKGETL